MILRENTPEYVNWFDPGRNLHMEIRAPSREHNALLQDVRLRKVLFWKERSASNYVCLGPIVFVEEQDAGRGVRPIYTFAVTDAAAPVPAR